MTDLTSNILRSVKRKRLCERVINFDLFHVCQNKVVFSASVVKRFVISASWFKNFHWPGLI